MRKNMMENLLKCFVFDTQKKQLKETLLEIKR
jgi:hypothetical protein